MFFKSAILLFKQSKQCLYKGTFRNIKTRRQNERFKKNNPGTALRIGLFTNEQQSQLETLDVDELETDFMSLGMSHKEHIDQIEAMKEQEKYNIVRRKYFKETTPNFLMWSDKEQIRYLYNTNPEEWTIEKLSDGFPALPETIDKIIKSNWAKKESKIRNHDNSVKNNWDMYKQGKIPDLPPSLKEHLKKFTNRKLNFQRFEPPNVEVEETVKYKKAPGEFTQIITSFEDLKNNKSSDNETNEHDRYSNNKIYLPKKPLKETYLITKPEKFVNKKLLTLKEMGKQDDEILSATVNQTEQPVGVFQEQNNSLEKIDDLTIKKYKRVANAVDKTKPNYNHLIYPERIKIPKDKYKKDHIFKLNDCFYDDDGEFLYRVPGMD